MLNNILYNQERENDAYKVIYEPVT